MNTPWLGFEDFSTPDMLSGDIACDYLVVGGGLTGLSIAYHLAKEAGGEKSVIVIDAKQPGFGASAKSSGMIGPGIGLQFHKLIKKYGMQMSQKMFAQTQQAVSYTVNAILDDGLRCDLEVGRQLKVSKNYFSTSRLKLEREALVQAGFDIPHLDGNALKEVVGTDKYQYALQYTGAATVNPMRLVQSLVRSITDAGGKVFFNTIADLNDINNISTKGLLKTGEGSIKFTKLILAINGFSHSQRVQESRVIPISTSMLMSGEMTENQLSSLGLSNKTGVIESTRLFNYFRLTKDKRLLFGGGKPCYSREIVSDINMQWEPRSIIYIQLMKSFRRLFPKLENVDFPYRWSGTIGVTLDNFPVVHISKNETIDIVSGWCGHGLAMAFLNGRRYADLQLKNNRGLRFPWMRTQAQYLAPSVVLESATNGYVSYLNGVDKLERSLGG